MVAMTVEGIGGMSVDSIGVLYGEMRKYVTTESGSVFHYFTTHT